MPEPKPSIGRIVHYIAVGDETPMKPGVCMPDEFGVTHNRVDIDSELEGEHRAAIITRVLYLSIKGIVCLHVMTPRGCYEAVDTEFDPKGKKPGTWHWPERDE